MSALQLGRAFGRSMKTFTNGLQTDLSQYIRCSSTNCPDFGVLFDIDGVLTRGKNVIPAARQALKKITDSNGEFQVPTVFVTNAGNTLRKYKAKQLSDLFDINVKVDQVMLSHSPLHLYKEYHDKCVLVCGQGPVKEIADGLGFTKTVTIEDIKNTFPNLDMVDHSARPIKTSDCVRNSFPKIEAIVLFGEPNRWETSLQLLIDVLLTNGDISSNMMSGHQAQNIPVLACNMDLMWMSDNPMPRFAHGMFLHCLESVYEKVVGRPLKYAALLGKPSITTYYYAEHLLMKEASKLCGQPSLSTLYAIGDNPLADIFGANLYKRKLAEAKALETKLRSMTSSSDKFPAPSASSSGSNHFNQLRRGFTTSNETTNQHHVKEAVSVLVCTGIFSPTPKEDLTKPMVWHCPRDVKFEESLAQPDKIVDDVDVALDWIFKRENYSI